MTEDSVVIKHYAPLKNMSLLDGLVRQLRDRPAHLPGMGCFYGPSGYGKSFSVAHLAADIGAYVIEAKSTWSRKALLLAVLSAMGIRPAHTIAEMVDQVGEELALSRKPLIVDEADNVVARQLVETVRDIYLASEAPVIWVGEELLPQRLRKYERVHGRILDWVAALPCDLDDARALAAVYCPRVQVADDLLQRLVERTHGSTRRVTVNLYRIRELAAAARLTTFGAADWGDTPIHTGEAPNARRQH
ncbi:MAG: ATP-binding protein [Sneathiellaceae bacterium]